MTLLERWDAGNVKGADSVKEEIRRALAIAQAVWEYNKLEEQLVHTGMEAIDWIMCRADELLRGEK